MNLYDAHNHLQDSRLDACRASTLAETRKAGVKAMVVNSTSPADWNRVRELAVAHPDLVIPAYGCHPWYLPNLPPDWQPRLETLLDQGPATIGEIGLDRRKPGLPWEGQEELFRRQLQLAHRRNLAVSIHCLQAWGPLVTLLETEPLPARGFLLHSFNGSAEIAARLLPLGAYISISGQITHPHHQRLRDLCHALPLERILTETDAPDQLPPPIGIASPLHDAAGQPLHHPANLPAIHHFVANLLGIDPTSLAHQLEKNFLRLFTP